MTHTRSRRIALFAGLLAVSLLATPSRSARADAKDEAARQVARDSFEEGLKLMDAHDWPSARKAFLRAFEANNHPQIAGKLGEVELKLGMYSEAKEHLTFALNEPNQSVAPERRQKLESLIAEADARLAPKSASPAPPPAQKEPKRPPAGAADAEQGPPGLLLAAEGGLALVLAGVGTGLWIAGDNQLDEAATTRTELVSGGNGGDSACYGSASSACAELSDQVANSETLRNAALGSFIAAGVSAIAVPLTLVLWPADTDPVTVGVVVTSSSVAVTGAF